MKGIFNLTVTLATLTFLPVSLIVISPVVAQPSVRFTSPENLPPLELKKATPRQKRILSKMPESDYGDIEADALRVAEVDLNNDGVAEYISSYVPGNIVMCGSRGCPLGIYSKQGERWRSIFRVSLRFSNIRVGSTVTNGFRDLLISEDSDSRNAIHRVLTFTNNEYALTHFQHGSNRFKEISERPVRVPKSTVFYSRPSKSSPVKPPLSVIQPIIVGRTNNWYLVLECDASACINSYFYLPVEVVDGKKSTTRNQPQNTSFTTCKFPFITSVAVNGNYTVSYPSSYYLVGGGGDGGHDIWSRKPSVDLQRSLSSEGDGTGRESSRRVSLPKGLLYTWTGANAYDGAYSSIVSTYSNMSQFRRENINVNGVQGVRFYASNLRDSISCCSVITVLRLGNNGIGYIQAESLTQDLQSDLQTILKIHNSIRIVEITSSKPSGYDQRRPQCRN